MKAELYAKLKEFEKVAMELNELWSKEDEPNDEINCTNYPFNASFDEVVYDIITWVGDNEQ